MVWVNPPNQVSL